MKKSVLAIIMAGMMTVSLAGCGESLDEKDYDIMTPVISSDVSESDSSEENRVVATPAQTESLTLQNSVSLQPEQPVTTTTTTKSEEPVTTTTTDSETTTTTKKPGTTTTTTIKKPATTTTTTTKKPATTTTTTTKKPATTTTTTTKKPATTTTTTTKKSATQNGNVDWTYDVGRILRTFKIKKNVEVTDNGKIII